MSLLHRPGWGIFNEQVVKKLGGEDAYKRHVISFADPCSCPALVCQAGHSAGVKEAALADCLRRKQCLYVILVLGEEGRVDRGAVGLLVSLPDLWGQEPLCTPPQDILFLQATQFQVWWEMTAEFHHPVIQERKAPFDRVGCHHPVPLG
jgi:hypothetical protein